MVPSITQRFDSYFVRIKFSIFLALNQHRMVLVAPHSVRTTPREHVQLPILIPNTFGLRQQPMIVLSSCDQLVRSTVSPS